MRLYVSAVLLLALASPCLAGGTGGAAPLNFLFLDADARPVALGGAYTAVATDANAMHYNPAGLAFLKGHQATFMHAEHFQDVTQEYGAIALKQGLGLMVNTLGFGDIQRTTLSNPRGTGLDSFGIRDWAVSVGYGRKLKWDWLGLGAALKYLREDIDNVSAHAVAADLGVRADLEAPLGAPLVLGMAIQNVGTKLKFQSSREDLPLNLKAGLAYRFIETGVFALDVNQPRAGDPTVHVGAEYAARKAVALRAGYNTRNDAGAGFTLGGGLVLRQFGLDYAFVPFGDLGNSHRFSLSYRW